MKRFACEMCDSSDLVKDGDFFVCQSCGTKYTPEAAKKLMIEGTVTVTGSVAVDRSNDLSNLYTLARRAKETGNISDGERYYGQLAQLDPNNWEAYFYSVYFSQLGCKIYQISSAAQNIQSALYPTVRLIEALPDKLQKKNAYNDLAASVMNASYILLNAANNHYKNNSLADGVYSEFLDRKRACNDLVKTCGDLLRDTVAGKDAAFLLYKSISNSSSTDKETILKNMEECNPSFDASPMIQKIEEQKKSGKVFFIVTGVFFLLILIVSFILLPLIQSILLCFFPKIGT